MPILQSWDLLIQKYCTNYLSGTTQETCDTWTTYISKEYMWTIESSLTSGIMYAWIIVLIISFLLSIVTGIFSRLFKK